MMPRSFFFFFLITINMVVLGQGQAVKITPGDSTICKGQSIRYSAYLYKGSFQFIGTFDGKDYFMDTVSRSWTDARVAAQANGMDLWVIDSLQENDAVYSMIPLRGQTNTFFWFGLFQDPVLEAAGTSASGWKWLDGRSLDTTFKYWYNSTPFIEPDDVFQSSIGANHAALGLNISGSRWSDMTNVFSSSFKGHAIAEVNKSPLILEWSNGETNTGTINVTPLTDQSYFLDITYGGNKTRSNTSLVKVNQAMTTASFNISTNSDTCLISNSVVFNNTSVATDPLNTTYEWSFGDGNKSIQFSPTYQYGGSQIYSVVLAARDMNGCVTYASRLVTIKPSPLIPVITYPSGGNVFCAGDSVVLNTVVVQPDPATVFVWYRNAVLAGNGRSLVAKTSGTYLLECTNLNGCVNRTSINVTVNSLPSKPVLSIVNGFSNVVCQLDSSNLQSSTAIDIVKFNWFTGSANTLNQVASTSLKNYMVKPTSPMGNTVVLSKYFVSTTDTNGCMSPISDSVVFTFKPSPVISLSAISGKTIFCDGDSTKLIVNSRAVGNTYQWKRDATLISYNDSIIIAKLSGSYIAEVTNTFGCTASSNALLILANKYPVIPVVNADASATEILPDGTVKICTGATTNLRTPNVIGGIYQWFKDGTAMFPPGNNSGIIVNAAAKYMVTVTANGCTSSSIETQVDLLPLPVGTLLSPPTNSICEGYSARLNATGAFGYQWYFNGNKLNGYKDSFCLANGPGLYRVEFSTDKGCKKMSTNFVNLVLVKKPTVLFSYDLYCTNVASNFTNKSETASSGSVSYLWRFQNGALDTNLNVVHVFSTSGNYRVSLKVMPKDCPQLADSSVILVKVEAPPKAISYIPINAMAGKPISLVARAIGDVYQWRPSTGLNSAFIRLPILNPTTEQLYTVSITNRAGCNFVDSQLVRVFDESDIYIPGGFTPNRDGKNDRVYPIAVGVSVFYSFKIFNRWGVLVFESNSLDPDLGWDGTFKGKDQPADTYTWVVYGIGQTGRPISKSGSVVLIR